MSAGAAARGRLGQYRTVERETFGQHVVGAKGCLPHSRFRMPALVGERVIQLMRQQPAHRAPVQEIPLSRFLSRERRSQHFSQGLAINPTERKDFTALHRRRGQTRSVLDRLYVYGGFGSAARPAQLDHGDYAVVFAGRIPKDFPLHAVSRGFHQRLQLALHKGHGGVVGFSGRSGP